MQTQCKLEEFRIIFRDDSLVAIHKPAGLLVHRSPIDKHETTFALQLTRDAIGQHVFPVHRLDKATSGLLLFALNAEIAGQLAKQFAEHQIQKTYLALVRGWPAQEMRIEKPLLYKTDRLGDAGRAQASEPQSAITEFSMLSTCLLDKSMGRYPQQRYALLQIQPQTGRKHQIRRHLNHISHPIIGDVNYGDRHHNHLFNDWRAYHRLYLAATSLSFLHPGTQKACKIVAPLQNDFAQTLSALGLDLPQALASA